MLVGYIDLLFLETLTNSVQSIVMNMWEVFLLKKIIGSNNPDNFSE